MKQMKGKSAFTLVEIMLSMVILAILALTGSAVSTYLGTGNSVLNQRRIALHHASRRLEQVLKLPYNDIRPQNNNQEYINSNNKIVAGHPHETIFINGFDRPISTTVRRINKGTPEIEYLEITTSVEYRSDGLFVVLKTNRK